MHNSSGVRDACVDLVWKPDAGRACDTPTCYDCEVCNFNCMTLGGESHNNGRQDGQRARQKPSQYVCRSLTACTGPMLGFNTAIAAPAMIFFTYCRERPLTTRQTGRCTKSSRWWLAQKRTRLTTGNAMDCRCSTVWVGEGRLGVCNLTEACVVVCGACRTWCSIAAIQKGPISVALRVLALLKAHLRVQPKQRGATPGKQYVVQHTPVGRETHLRAGHAPDGGAHRQNVVVHECVTVAIAVQILAQRYVLKARCILWSHHLSSLVGQPAV